MKNSMAGLYESVVEMYQLGSNIGALPEIIKDRDLLFKPGDQSTKKIILSLQKYYFKKNLKSFIKMSYLKEQYLDK